MFSMFRWILLLAVTATLLGAAASAQVAERGELLLDERGELLLDERGELLLDENFAAPVEIGNDRWQPRQHTRWEVRDGVLLGKPSTPEFQASQDHHQGLEPRLMIRNLPQEYVTELRFRMGAGDDGDRSIPGVGSPYGPVSFQADGLRFTMGGLKDRETVSHAPGFRIEPGRWYQLKAKLKGSKLHIQIGDSITLHADHPMVARPKDGLGFCGLRGGTLEIDDVKIWAVR